jgi:predicted CXXCH cytochrome family protein
MVVVGLVALLLLLAGAAGAWLMWRGAGLAGRASVSAPVAPAAFVGSQACAGCHADQFARWKGSQHAAAMQPATVETVRGDFSGARFAGNGMEATFGRRDGKYVIRTEGPDGKPADFEVKYTFGVAPLQQYLVELPRGRLQAFTVAWDTRPGEQGGQRWFHLQPSERVAPGDELHWTGPQYNWNFMCADCHSTGLRKNYDASQDRYATTWSEISVGCEGCHGPGSRHVDWAKAGSDKASPDRGLTVALDERKGVAWTVDAATGNATRSRERGPAVEVGVCAQCHTRRGQIADGYQPGRPFLDYYRPALLSARLYHPDGQQRDEVYDWGSFLSSRMHQRGVTCSDCHEPHGGTLRAPGNAMCAQCHAPAKYDGPAHHLHRPGSAGASCAGCHMPPATYMVIDPRHDHSIRVPRPDLSVSIGVPNACTTCHRDRPPAWAAGVLAARGRRPEGFQRFAEAFAAADTSRPGATAGLVTVAGDAAQSPIARASALSRLAERPSPEALAAARRGLGDADPLVRQAAIQLFTSVPARERLPVAALLADPVRLVRMEAASVLAAVPATALSEAQRAAFERAAAEYGDGQRFNADRAEHRVNLGTFYAARGQGADAERELRSAIALDRRYVPGYVNLADLYRAQGREAEAERALRDGLAAMPDSAPLHHALGLSLARSRRVGEGVTELGRAAALSPDDARFAYVYAVALHSAGKRGEALRILERTLARHPGHRDTLVALATINRDAGNRAAARDYARRLAAAHPDDPEASSLARSLE